MIAAIQEAATPVSGEIVKYGSALGVFVILVFQFLKTQAETNKTHAEAMNRVHNSYSTTIDKIQDQHREDMKEASRMHQAALDRAHHAITAHLERHIPPAP